LLAAKNNTACSEIKQIWVASGTYYPQHIAGDGTTDRDKAFVLVEGVKVYGGFAGTETAINQRDTAKNDIVMFMTNQTTLSGDIGMKNDKTDNAHHVVVGAGLTDATVFDGFVITAGNANGASNNAITVNGKTVNRYEGGGINLVQSASPVLSHLVIRNNTANRYGGGMFNDMAYPLLTNVLISENTADNGGGIFGVYGTQETSYLNHVKISGNKAISGIGGGIYYTGGSSQLTHVKITGNTATDGGGGMFSDINATPVLTNVQITGNTAEYAGGISVHGTSVLTNVTIAGNYATNDYGGVFLSNTVNRQMRNVIIYGNARGSGTISNVSSDNAAIYANSLVGGATLNTGIISDADPKFLNPDYATTLNEPKTGGNYSLQLGSPAIDRGNNTVYVAGQTPDISHITTDLADSPRIQGCAVDLGAYELNVPPEFVGITPGANNIVYVTVNGSGAKDGSSWNNAYPGLADPLAAAKYMACIKQIWVAAGEYKPARRADSLLKTDNPRDHAFVMVPGVKVYGGFSGTLTGSPTVLPAFGSSSRNGISTLSGDIAGDNVYHVVIAVDTLIKGIDTARLDGFTISGGYSTSSDNSTVKVNDETVDRNKGAGIYMSSAGGPIFGNLVVTGNRAYDGGGIYWNISSPEINNVLVTANSAGNNGGGIYTAGISVLTDMQITNNTATNNGGGIYDAGTSTLTNLQITGNTVTTSGGNGGGIYNNGTSSIMTNLTIANNKANTGGGVHRNSGTANIRNSIIWRNTTVDGTTANNVTGGATYSYTLLEGATTEANIISVEDPLFTNASTGDYSLQSCSPAINTGLDTMYLSGGSLARITADLAGKSRIKGVGIDLGAYEYQNAPAITHDGSGRVYVKKACYTSVNNGSSWTAAYPELADVLLAAKNNASGITEIFVAEGTYTPRHIRVSNGDFQHRDRTFTLVEGVKIYGGFDGTTAVTALPDFGSAGRNALSVLSGDVGSTNTANDSVYHVVLGVGTQTPLTNATTLDGFTVSGGCSTGAYGDIYVDTRDIVRGYGGGIALYAAPSPELSHLIITGNTAGDEGGGIYNNVASPTITNVLIAGNTAGSVGGGGILNYDCSPTLVNVQITGNKTTGNGGGISFYGGSSVLINVTVADNKADGTGGGIFGDATVKNSIIWGNTDDASGTATDNVSGTVSCDYTLLQYGVVSGTSIISNADPLFVSPATVSAPTVTGDYSLQSTSPAIDKGNDGYNSTTTDLAGNDRKQGCKIDLGAYELNVPSTVSNVKPDSHGIVYVKKGGSGNGSSWANAYPNLADVLIVAKTMSSCGKIDTIYVAGGTYYPEYVANFDNTVPSTDKRDNAFVLIEGVKIYGGFSKDATNATTFADRQPLSEDAEYKTILSGDLKVPNNSADNAYHVVVGVGTLTSVTVLDGFTITGAYADGVGTTSKIEVDGKSLPRGFGGGIALVSSASPILRNLLIVDNKTERGGGIFISYSSPKITGVRISGNHATFRGGGIFNSSSASVITNTLISGNLAGVYGSGEGTGGAIFIENALAYAPILTNVTIAGNYAFLSGGGINTFQSGSGSNNNGNTRIRNSIIYGNSAPSTPNTNWLKDVYSYCLVAGASGTGIILNSDPDFVSPDYATNSGPKTGGDYQLKFSSSAIGEGHNGFYNSGQTPDLHLIDTDLAGNDRFIDSIDLGAYELQSIPVTAVHDTATTIVSTPVTIDVLANDNRGSCSGVPPDVILVSGSKPQHGDADFDSTDSVFIYTPKSGYYGIDTFTYEIGCGSSLPSSTEVYVLTLKPLSKKYLACPGASVTLGFEPIANVSYFWYDNQGVQIGSSASNTIARTKDNSGAVETYWVEPRYYTGSTGYITFPRWRVELEPGNNCGTPPSGCAVTGTVIWKEDFGGNDTQSLLQAPDPGWKALGKTTYNYVTQPLLPAHNEYALLKNIGDNTGNPIVWAHSFLDDHTSWGNQNSGYFLTFDADGSAGEFYNFEIDNLCEGSELVFSAWLMNINPPSFHTGFNSVNPNVMFIIEDKSGNVLNRFYTGEIAITNDPTWFNYAFDFTVPEGIDHLKIKLYNNYTGSSTYGNDISIDDIEIRLCAPPITLNVADTVVCAQTTLDIQGVYDADCTFGDNLAYRWEFRHVDSVTWRTLEKGNVSLSDCSMPERITKDRSIPSMSKSDEGYYRLLVSSSDNIGNKNCRAASDSIYVKVLKSHRLPDIRVDVCLNPLRLIHLSSFLDSLDYDRINWTKVSLHAPAIAVQRTGELHTSSMIAKATYTYRYTQTSKCGSNSAIAYVRTLGDRLLRRIDTVAICKEQELSKHVQLNQIFGLELGGTWDYDESINHDKTVENNVKVYSSTTSYYGARIFNAQRAYAEATDSRYNIIYKGDVAAKMFKFQYIPPSGSCISSGPKTLVIVITSK
jgi:hypothetical protein